MLRFHLWEASAASTTCPGAMTDGATRLLQRHLGGASTLDAAQRRVFQNAYDRLTSRDPQRAWTSGQWMTERPGGSDVSQTETVARFVGGSAGVDTDGLPLGPWSVDGFKWFSSATDAGMAILLARTHPDKGLSAFFAPMRRRRAVPSTTTKTAGAEDDTELNGVRIQRLKDKSGTRPVPTAELELRGLRAWLVGREGDGIREIATVLAITRVHCAVACLGLAGRALGVAKAYALRRAISGGRGGRARLLLCRSPLHMRTLADLTGDYHGMMLLTLYTAYVMGVEERQGSGQAAHSAPLAQSALQPPLHLVGPLLRALSSLHKAYVCKQAVPLLHATCMEALGGVGYLLNAESEPVNMARLFRDGCVNAIWEGTTDVLSTDLVRTLTHPKAGRASLDALEWLVGAASANQTLLVAPWKALRARVETTPVDVLLADARAVLFAAAEIAIAALLVADAHSDHAPAAVAMARHFLLKKGFLGADSAEANAAAAASAEERLASDTAIVYGPSGPDVQQAARL